VSSWERLDSNLHWLHVHHVWVPRRLQSWVCDRYDAWLER